jgi:endonuclease III
LLFEPSRPVLPIEPHVFRVSRRLDPISSALDGEKAHGVLQALLSDDQVYSFQVNAIAHGRRLCRAVSPQCERWVARALCSQRGMAAGGRDSAGTIARRRLAGGYACRM